MSSDITILAVLFIAFTILLCVVMIIFAVLAGGSIWLFSRFQKGATEALADDTDTYFATNVADLKPWHTGALADLSSQVECSGRATFGTQHYRGRLLSLENPETFWMVYELYLKRLRGSLLVCSDRHELCLIYAGIGSRTVWIRENGELLGAIHNAGEISLFDPLKRQLGIYHQQRLTLGVSPAEYNLKPYYGAVDLEGRTLAELNRNPWVLKPLIGPLVIPPLFQNLAPNLTTQEETWLLALAAWEITNRILQRI